MKVNFYCDEHLLGVIPNPVPSVKMAPEYFKKIKPQLSVDPEDLSVKRCVPFLDAISCGYILPLWCDVFVLARNGELEIKFPKNFAQKETLGYHNLNQISDHPLSKKPYGNLPLKWINPWIVETEPGFSCLFTSPLNHLETRFKILDGVVDTDTYYNHINFPFLWTGGDGEFIIPKGTPLVQVIPFRREYQEINVSPVDQNKRTKIESILGTKLRNTYREEFWSGAKKNKNEPEGIIDEPETAQLNKAENLSEHTQVEDLAARSEWKTESTSGILKVVADDKGRGFGEGGF